MADSGCNIVFADSFGHESYMIQAAKEFPNVEFCHATGT
jgi:basic membrane protein A